MNVYHITYAPTAKTAHIYFWGCNLSCRGCVRLKEAYNYHIEDSVFNGTSKSPEVPERFLDFEEVMQILEKLEEIRKVFFMGAEPTTDPGLPRLAEAIHQEFKSHNVLLTNGFKLINPEHIDEVAFSIKAVTDSLHRHYTGKSNKKIKGNFVSLYDSGVKLRAESVLIPEYIDCPEIDKIAGFIATVNQDIPYRIDAYIPTGANPWRRPTSREMKGAVSTAAKHLSNVSCLTGNEKLKYNVSRVF